MFSNLLFNQSFSILPQKASFWVDGTLTAALRSARESLIWIVLDGVPNVGGILLV